MSGPDGENEVPDDAKIIFCSCCHRLRPVADFADFAGGEGREWRTCLRCRERARERSAQARLSREDQVGRRRFEHTDWGIYERLESLGEDARASAYELMGLVPGGFQVVRARPRLSDRPGEEWWQLI